MCFLPPQSNIINQGQNFWSAFHSNIKWFHSVPAPKNTKNTKTKNNKKSIFHFQILSEFLILFFK